MMIQKVTFDTPSCRLVGSLIKRERVSGPPNDTLLCAVVEKMWVCLRHKAMIRVLEGSKRGRLGPKLVR